MIVRCLCLLLSLVFILTCTGCSTKRDDWYLDNFQKHRAEFTELVEMFTTDKHLLSLWMVEENIEPGFDKANYQLSPKRIAKYRRLLQSLNVKYMYRTSSDIHYFLVVQDVSDWKRGYLFSKCKVDRLAASLDSFYEYRCYRPIFEAQDWYLFYEPHKAEGVML